MVREVLGYGSGEGSVPTLRGSAVGTEAPQLAACGAVRPRPVRIYRSRAPTTFPAV